MVREPTGALAHLQLGRAYILAGNRDNARAAYQDFLRRWQDADADSPILKQAKGRIREAAVSKLQTYLIHFTMFRGGLPVALVLLLLNLVGSPIRPRLRLLLGPTPSAME